MKILVTGSAGFIGFTTAQRFLAQGHTVIGIDNFFPYYSLTLKEDRSALLAKHQKFSLHRIDIADSIAVNKLFQEEKFDVVCNLAAQAGVRHSLTHPHDYISFNISGFLNILEACRNFGPKRLVYASSSSVYGGNTKLPFGELDRVDTPVSLYAATKKANELMAHSYTHLFDIQTIGLRFFTVYGPWGRPDMAMWLFADAMLNNKPIDLFNNGAMQRDFTYVDDIVSGIFAACTCAGLDKYEIFNLGNHRSEKLHDVVQILEKELGLQAKINLLPMQPGDVPASFADIDKARAKLGFDPKTPISEGIPRFIAWFKEYQKQLL